MRGKAEQHQRQNQEYQDHPRLCGEKGKPQTALTEIHRITPAYAGKSLHS